MISIFIVDDDDSIRNLYRILLTKKGYKVIGSAGNGVEAVTMYKKFPEKPDIIIMDHRMPIKNGIEAAKEILQANGKSKIIFASADISVRELAFSIGVISFKLKPFSPDRLIENIEKAISLNYKNS